jgi:hypothetical protein
MTFRWPRRDHFHLNAAPRRGNQGTVDEFRLQKLLLWVVGAAIFVAFVVYAFPALESF